MAERSGGHKAAPAGKGIVGKLYFTEIQNSKDQHREGRGWGCNTCKASVCGQDLQRIPGANQEKDTQLGGRERPRTGTQGRASTGGRISHQGDQVGPPGRPSHQGGAGEGCPATCIPSPGSHTPGPSERLSVNVPKQNRPRAHNTGDAENAEGPPKDTCSLRTWRQQGPRGQMQGRHSPLPYLGLKNSTPAQVLGAQPAGAPGGEGVGGGTSTLSACTRSHVGVSAA